MYSIDGGKTWEGEYSRSTAVSEGRVQAREADQSEFRIARSTPFAVASAHPAADAMIEDVESYIRGESGFDGADLSHVSYEAITELEDEVGRVWAAWVQRHNVTVNTFEVDEMTIEVVKVDP